MRTLAGPTWRRLKSCLEYKFRDIRVPATSHDDRVKQLGLLIGLSRGEARVLEDEGLQLQYGRAEGGDLDEALLTQRVHEMAKSAPLERYVTA